MAISPDGWMLLGESSRDVRLRTKEAFGPGNFVFRIGLRVTGKLL